MFGVSDFTKPIIDFSNFEFSQLGDALIFGASVLLIGMVTVSSVLCLLWLFMIVFKVFFHDMPKKKAEKKAASSSVIVTETPVESNASNDTEIIAVISAAIAMAENDDTGLKFRVVSFKRV